MITRTDISAHLEKGVRVGFLKGADTFSSQRSAFVEETPSDGAFEVYTDMGDAPWPIAGPGKQGPGGTDERTGAPVVGRMNAGEAITIVGGEERSLMVYNVDWQIGIGIEHNAINDNRAGDLEGWARRAAVNFERHKDKEAFAALNSGEATTNYGAGYDGLAFFSGSHVDPGAEYTTAQDNQFALALSLDNFETVKVAASKFKNSRGEPEGLNHKLLVLPPDLERIGAQITGNREDYATANRAVNPYSGNVQMLVSPGGYLDTTAWFLIDPAEKPIKLQNRQAPSLVIMDDELQGSGVRYFILRARYNVFYGNWRYAVQGNT